MYTSMHYYKAFVSRLSLTYRVVVVGVCSGLGLLACCALTCIITSLLYATANEIRGLDFTEVADCADQ